MFKWKVKQFGENYLVSKTNLFGTRYLNAIDLGYTWGSVCHSCVFTDKNKALDYCDIANDDGKIITRNIPSEKIDL